MAKQFNKGERVRSKTGGNRIGSVDYDDGFYVRVEFDNGNVALYPSHKIHYWIERIEGVDNVK